MDFSDYPVDQQRQDALMITSVVMTVLAGLIVVLRCVSRFVLIRNPGPDDYLMIGALVLTVGYLIDLFIMKDNNMGFPMGLLTLDNMIALLKCTLAIEVMYYVIIFCIKNAICFTYLRFAVNKPFRYLCIGTIVLHSVFFVICLIVTLAQCRPLEFFWDLKGEVVGGSCINTTAFFYTTSGFNIITDIWILLLPIPTLRTIQRPGRERIALFCIFGVGTFAVVASIVRLHSIREYTQAADPFRDSISVNLWSMIEVTIAISCASVSALKPVFSRGQRMRTRSAAAAGSGSGRSGERSGNDGTQTNGSFSSRWRRHARLGSKEQQLDMSLNTTSSSGGGADAPFPATAPLPPIGGGPGPSSGTGPSVSYPGAAYGFSGQQQRKSGGGGSGSHMQKITKKQSSGSSGIFPRKSGNGDDRMGEAASEESMLAFTALSPPPRQSQTEEQLQGAVRYHLGREDVSSSGSVLVFQKH